MSAGLFLSAFAEHKGVAEMKMADEVSADCAEQADNPPKLPPSPRLRRAGQRRRVLFWMPRACPWVSIIFLSLAGIAGATTLLQTNPGEAYSGSSAVIAGTVASKESSWADGGGRNMRTTFVIRVDRAYKGSRIPPTVTIVQPGGRMGDLIQRVHGYPDFVPGERALLFLRQSTNGAYSVFGMFQGKYGITRKDGVDYISPPAPGAGTKLVPLSNRRESIPVPLEEFIESLKK